MLLVPVSWLYVVEVLRVLDSLHEERSEGLAGAMGMVRPEDIVAEGVESCSVHIHHRNACVGWGCFIQVLLSGFANGKDRAFELQQLCQSFKGRRAWRITETI